MHPTDCIRRQEIMLREQPRLFFMHFWATDDAVKLTRGLRAALDRTNSKKAMN